PVRRGMVSEDRALAFLSARAKGFAEADVLLAVGTRFNYVLQFGHPPRFATSLKVIQVDVNPSQLGHNRRVDVPIVGDARAVLEQLAAEARGRIDRGRYASWVSKLRTLDAEKAAEMDKQMRREQAPIHPLRLAKGVRDVPPRHGGRGTDVLSPHGAPTKLLRIAARTASTSRSPTRSGRRSSGRGRRASPPSSTW